MLDQLRLQSEAISLEAVAGPAALTSALSRLPMFLENTKSFLVRNFADPLKELFSKKDLLWFARRIQDVNYARLRDLDVIVPPGLKVSYSEYSTDLLKAASSAAAMKSEVLDPFQTWLGSKLGNPESLASLRPSFEIDGLSKRDVEKSTKELLRSFNAKSATVEVKYGDVFKRNAEWLTLVTEAVEIQAKFLKDDHVAIIAQINQITTLLDQLLVRVQSKDAAYAISGPVVVALSKAAFNVAREIEYYGLVRHRVVEYSHALSQTTESLRQYV